MRNNIKEEIDKIEIPKELRERSKAGVLKAKSEMKKDKPNWLFYTMPMIAASLLIIFISMKMLENNSFKSESIQSKKSSIKEEASDSILNKKEESADSTSLSKKDQSSNYTLKAEIAKVDLSDPQRLVEYGDNVFIGKVLKKTGEERFTPEYPQTQFNVKVDKNIKGTAPNSITVNQQGGYDGDQLILLEKDSLLEVGKTYLFVTHFMQNRKWYTVTPVYGHILISNEAERVKIAKEFNKIVEKKN